MDPTGILYSPLAYWLLGFYIVHGVVVMLLLRFRQESTPAFRLLVVHSGDILWPALIALFTTGAQGSPFFLFFVFVLAAAAYRWGLWETLGTATAAVGVWWMESLALSLGIIAWIDRWLLQHRLPLIRVAAGEFEPRHLFMRSIYLLVMGLLLGYLAEQQKQLRAEKAVIARILGRARVESGLSGTLQQILGELLKMYGASLALIASQESHSYHTFLGKVRSQNGSPSNVQWMDAPPPDRDMYLYESPAQASFAMRGNGDRHSPFAVVAVDGDGNRLRNPSNSFVQRLAEKHEFHSLATVSFVFGTEWTGRIFLFDPLLAVDREEELRFLQELVRQVGPAVYNVYLLRRLRLRAGAVERARFARELHDGAVQSLIAVEMQVDVLRRQSASGSVPVTDELSRIQSLLREEVLKLRELMQQMKSMDVDASKLLSFLGDTVERFQRETGISARFLSELEEIDMPQKVCRELARIVQEGLVNVRKHSRARQVLVRLGQRGDEWQVTIEDDGQGFPFSGRVSLNELDALGKGPVVIKERVRLIAGKLTIESSPGQGSRLEINIPQKREEVYG
jgi:signal transduction histidine kinase